MVGINKLTVALAFRACGALILMGAALFTGVAIDFAPSFAWYDQHRIAQVGLLGATALGVLTGWRKSIVTSLEQLPGWVVVAFSSSFGLGLLSAIASTYPRFALLEWATLLLLLGLALLLADQANKGKARFDIWSNRLVISLAVVIALKIMTGYLAAMTAMVRLDTIMLFEGTFSNRRFFGQVASIIVPLLAYPLLRGGLSRSAQAALFLLLALWWMLVIASGTRGTWMALIVVAAVLALFAWRASVDWLRIQVCALGLGVLLFWTLFVWLPIWIGLGASLENRLENLAALSGREVLWSLAVALIQENPWVGIGPMHFAAVRNDFGAHPHNAVLQLAVEWGVPATLALLLPATVGLLRLLDRLRQNVAAPNVLLVCLTASLLAASAQSMVDGVIVVPYTQTLLALMAGWALGVYFRGAVVTPAIPGSNLMRLSIFILSLFALAALFNGVIPEALNRPAVTQMHVEAGVPIPPRYWGVGWIP